MSSSMRKLHKGKGKGKAYGMPTYRGGRAPEPKGFSDNGKDPQTYIRWLRAIEAYQLQARAYLSPEEQALAVIAKLDGEALDELEPWLEQYGMAHFFVPEGIDMVITILDAQFKEKPMLKKGRALANFETIRRMDNEGLQKYAARFSRTEQCLVATGVNRLDEEARASKLLQTARLSQQVRNTHLVTAGHVYNFDRIVDAIKLLYPTEDYDGKREREEKPANSGDGKRNFFQKKQNGNAGAKGNHKETNVTATLATEASDVVQSHEAAEPGAGAAPEQEGQTPSDDTNDIDDLAEIPTVTANKLKAVTLGRGWTSKATPAPSGTGKATSSRPPDPARAKELNELKKKHPCSVCAELRHWYNDKDANGNPLCKMAPRTGKHVHFATVDGGVLDPSGTPEAQSLIVAAEKGSGSTGAQHASLTRGNSFYAFVVNVAHVQHPSTSSVPLPTLSVLANESHEPIAIIDTACQVTVGRSAWLSNHSEFLSSSHEHIPRTHTVAHEQNFRFGDGELRPSKQRHVIPCGIGKRTIILRVCEVPQPIACLLSRSAVTTLGMVLNMIKDVVHFTHIGAHDIPLVISANGHLGVSIADWP